MWLGLALMTSSAAVQMNKHCSHVIWIFIQKEDLSSKRIKRKDVVVLAFLMFFLSHRNKNISVNATHVKVSLESVWVILIHTSHSYTNTHTHICTNTPQSQTSCLLCISKHVCGCVCTQSVCAKCIWVRLYPVKATLYTRNDIKMVVETIKYATKKN